jgi:ubiquinone/menaquinone biosynthesis C-methylase UbiE
MSLTLQLGRSFHPMHKGPCHFLENKISTQDTILGLGCGTGHITAKLSKMCKSISGIDHSSSDIQYAKENFSVVTIKMESFLVYI